MLFFTAVCPFIISPKPIYIADLATSNIFSTKATILKTGRKTIGTALLLSNSDVVRKQIASFLGAYFPASIRILERTDYKDGSYCRLPILKRFIIDSKEPGQQIWKRSIYLPSSVLFRMVELHLPRQRPLSLKMGHGSMEFGTAGWVGGTLFNFAYTQYPETIPWDAVAVHKAQEDQTLTYASFLDCCLGFIATGQTVDAIRAIEQASSLIPTSNLEAARLAALQYIVGDRSLGGNLGELQSLPSLHRAYDLFLQAANDPRVSEKDPLTIWLRETLLDGYKDSDWSLDFADRILALERIPHAENEEKSYFDGLEEDLKGKWPSGISAFMKSRNYSREELYFIKNWVASETIKQCVLEARSEQSKGADEKAVVRTLAVAARGVLPIIQYIDSLLARCNELDSDTLPTQMLRFTALDFPRIMAAEDDAAVRRLMVQDAKPSLELSDLVDGLTVLDANNRNEKFLEGRSFECCTLSYMLWFAYWSSDAVIEIQQHDHPSRRDFPPLRRGMGSLLSQFKVSSFTKDRSGDGQTFLPGLFCYTWYAQTFDSPGIELLEDEFKSQTLISFDEVLSSLFENR